MTRRFLSWLKNLPRACLGVLKAALLYLVESFWELWDWLRTLPRRLRDIFWDLWDWLKTLPRRLRDFLTQVLDTIQRGFIDFGASLLGFFSRLTLSFLRVLRTKLEPDPATIPKSKLKVPQRGRNVALFSRQFAALIQGGIPLVQALDILSEQQEDPRMSYICGQLATRLGEGYSLSKATSEYPKIFPPVFFHLLKAGEGTGRLMEVTNRLADLLEKESHLVRKVRGALSYPGFVLVLTLVLTLGLFSTVLPSFADFYKDFDVALPVATAAMMAITEVVRTLWFWLGLLLFLGAAWHASQRIWEVEHYRRNLFIALTSIPMVGTIVEQSCLARFSWVMELTQRAGMDLMRSVKLACLSSGSPLLEYDAQRLLKGITDGESLSDLMNRSELYPHLLQQMVMMGEETSRSSEAFDRSAQWFEETVEAKIESFQAAFEPVMMGLVSLIVGTIVLAVFLPLYGLLEKLGV